MCAFKKLWWLNAKINGATIDAIKGNITTDNIIIIGLQKLHSGIQITVTDKIIEAWHHGYTLRQCGYSVVNIIIETLNHRNEVTNIIL